MTLDEANPSASKMSASRWDKISKKFTGTATSGGSSELTTKTVKTFLEMNFTNGYHEKMCGSSKAQPDINPALIMNMRHEAARKQKKTPSKIKAQKDINMETIRNHNNLVESRMIANELSKFKLDIRKLSSCKTTSGTSTRTKYHDSLENSDDDNDDDKDDEKKLLEALRDKEDATFAYKNESNKIVVESKTPKLKRPEVSFDECSGFSGSTATISDCSQDRVVRFESDFIKVSTTTKPKAYNAEDYQEYYEEISEDNSKFNVDDDDEDRRRRCSFDLECFMCCKDGDCEFAGDELQSFYSLPNLADDDIESLLKITQFQSMVMVETTVEDCSCCPKMIVGGGGDDQKIEMLNKSIEVAETERLLIVRRMEIEEKNYQELVIMSKAHSKNISDPKHAESEKIINDLLLENQQAIESATERLLLRKTFKDWLKKTTIAKILKTNAFTNEDRVKKINNFLNKVRLEQKKSITKKGKQESKAQLSQDVPKGSSKVLKKDYEHKLKMQQDIIDLQKLKIQRQERMITEMKLAKFSEMVKESKNDLKMELINSKRGGNMKLRAKVRCIQMAANIKLDPEEEEKRKLLAQGLIVPRFLQKMQDRANERLTRHEEARERRLRLETQKEEQKTAADAAKKLEDEAAKRKRHQEMRDKRRLEKMAKQLREEERQRYLENMQKAREFYARKLMQRLGFRVFELVIRQKRTNHKKSTIHRHKLCIKKCFNSWRLNTKVVWDHKRAQADRMYQIGLLRYCIRLWLHVHNIHQSKFLVAIDWYEIKITEKLFAAWVKRTKRSKFIENTKLRNAEAHYSCQLKWKLFDCWHRFPAIMRIERETDVRRQKWRMKIWDMLPDYKPSN